MTAGGFQDKIETGLVSGSKAYIGIIISLSVMSVISIVMAGFLFFKSMRLIKSCVFQEGTPMAGVSILCNRSNILFEEVYALEQSFALLKISVGEKEKLIENLKRNIEEIVELNQILEESLNSVQQKNLDLSACTQDMYLNIVRLGKNAVMLSTSCHEIECAEKALVKHKTETESGIQIKCEFIENLKEKIERFTGNLRPITKLVRRLENNLKIMTSQYDSRVELFSDNKKMITSDLPSIHKFEPVEFSKAPQAELRLKSFCLERRQVLDVKTLQNTRVLSTQGSLKVKVEVMAHTSGNSTRIVLLRGSVRKLKEAISYGVDLEEKLSILQENIQELCEINNELKRENMELKRKIGHLGVKVECQISNHAEMKSMVIGMRGKLKKMREQRLSSDMNLELLQRQILSIEKERELQSKIERDLKDQISQLSTSQVKIRNEQLQMEVGHYLKTIDEHHISINYLINERIVIMEETSGLPLRIDKLKEYEVTKDKMLLRYKVDIEKLTEQNKSLVSENKRLISNLIKVPKSKCMRLLTDHVDLIDKCWRLQVEVCKCESEFASLNREFYSTIECTKKSVKEREREIFIRETSEHNCRLKELELKHSNLLEQHCELEESCKTQANVIEGLKGQLDCFFLVYTSEVGELMDHYLLEEEIESLESINSSLEMQLKSLKKDAVYANKRANSLEKSYRTASADNPLMLKKLSDDVLKMRTKIVVLENENIDHMNKFKDIM